MKKILYVFVIAIVASACSSPKYTASFNSYDKHVSNQPVAKSVVIAAQPSVVQPEQLVASTSNTPVAIKSAPKEEVRKTYVQMTKTERKALRTHLKSDIKNYVKVQKQNLKIESTEATSAWDNDLKLAAIFGIVGIVGTALWGVSEVFGIIGTIALIIAVVFLVKWLVRQ